MASLTRAQLITQGMKMAGKDSTGLATVVGTEFDAWLKSTYKAWMWPYLQIQASGIILAAGSTSLDVGGGAGGIIQLIDDVYDPIYLTTSDFRTRGEARVRNLRGNSPESETSILDPSINRGMPQSFKVRPGAAEGYKTLIPFPFPDQEYQLSLDYKYMPAALATNGVPRYENDRTMLQACKVFTLQHMKENGTASEQLGILATMVAQDFGKEGVSAGMNESMGLDTRTFRR